MIPSTLCYNDEDGVLENQDTGVGGGGVIHMWLPGAAPQPHLRLARATTALHLYICPFLLSL